MIEEKFIEYPGTDGNKCRVYLYSRVAVSHAEKTYVGTAVKIEGANVTIHLDAGQQFRLTPPRTTKTTKNTPWS